MPRVMPMTIGIDRPLQQWVREQARRAGVSVSEWIRDLLRAQRGPQMDPRILARYQALYRRAAGAEEDAAEQFLGAERESWGQV